ncbi:MAG: aldolase/citrate lyase family protein, partial [Rhodospirillaceae bacterium]|nr:aldolase/citrate lyase family protein [Rhodospirillaceae bacterium]
MPESRYRPRRSMIFAPGDNPRLCLKARDTGADMVCIDLEDAVAPGDKDAAREGAVGIFRDLDPQAAGPETVVRINSLHSLDGMKDVAALADLPNPPAGFMLTKVKGPGEVAMLDDVLSEAGAASFLHVIIETNEARGPGGGRAPGRRGGGCRRLGAVDKAAPRRPPKGRGNMVFAPA